MERAKLPIIALPAWAKLNNVDFIDTSVYNLDGKGFALRADRQLTSKNTFDIPTLLNIPHDLVLCAETIEEHAKIDHHFRELLDAAGHKVRVHQSMAPFLRHALRISTPMIS